MPAARDANALLVAVQRWADGKATLKEVHGYTEEELYAVARVAYAFFHQGKINEARTLFQGLFAVNPRDAYFARALGVVEYAAQNADGAIAAFNVAAKLASSDPAVYLCRAEVLLATGQRAKAIEDLKRAAMLRGDEKLAVKARALLKSIHGR